MSPSTCLASHAVHGASPQRARVPVEPRDVLRGRPDPRRGATVQAEASARVRLRAVPFFGWAEVRLARQARERIDRWRSLRPAT